MANRAMQKSFLKLVKGPFSFLRKIIYLFELCAHKK